MDREEFERIKQAEKEHLRKIRALKQQLREARRTASTLQALDRVTGATETPELDASLEKLQRATIESEVRLDMALEAAAEREGRTAESPPVDEEEARKVRAAALVAQMKAALDPAGVLKAEPPDAERTSDGPAETPEKTIGRPTPAAEADDDAPPPLPEKTIGRVGDARRQTE